MRKAWVWLVVIAYISGGFLIWQQSQVVPPLPLVITPVPVYDTKTTSQVATSTTITSTTTSPAVIPH